MKTIVFIIGLDVLGFPIAHIHRISRYFFNNVRGRGILITEIIQETKTLY